MNRCFRAQNNLIEKTLDIIALQPAYRHGNNLPLGQEMLKFPYTYVDITQEVELGAESGRLL